MADRSIEEGGITVAVASPKDDYPLLSKEDLMEVDKAEPKWHKIRLSIVIIFWLIWLGLCVGTCLFVGLTTRCPTRPSQEFWQSNTGYWLNPFAFKDSNGDKIGDLKGMFKMLPLNNDST